MDSVRLSRTEAIGVSSAIWGMLDELRALMDDECENSAAIALAAYLDSQCSIPAWSGSADVDAQWRQLADRVSNAGIEPEIPRDQAVEISPSYFEDILDTLWTVALNTQNWHHRAHALAWILELDPRRPTGMETSLIPKRLEWIGQILKSIAESDPEPAR